MRRSKSIRLVLLGATAVTLGACGDEDLAQGEYFTDETQCQRAVGGNECAGALAEARERHMTTAPQFAGVRECEQEYGAGNCEMVQQAAATTPAAQTPPTTGTSTQSSSGYSSGPRFIYIPSMSGFTYNRGAPVGSMATPIYRDRSGSAFTGRTQVGQFSPGGGFQGMSSRRGGFGSSGYRSTGS